MVKKTDGFVEAINNVSHSQSSLTSGRLQDKYGEKMYQLHRLKGTESNLNIFT